MTLAESWALARMIPLASLEVSVGCLRAWKRKGAPRYARLALSALIAGLAPHALSSQSKNASFEREDASA